MPVTLETSRLNVRIRDDLKAGLEGLKERRSRFAIVSLNDLVIEGVMLLLAKENWPLGDPPANGRGRRRK